VSLVAAFSGGKDSTAMVRRLAELGEVPLLLFTPTGNELPEVLDHVHATAAAIGSEVVIPKGPSLSELIDFYDALPNWRQRWCTRQIKIVPCIAWLKAHPGSTLAVGLRADEEEREGLYGSFAKYRYPLREWGWDIRRVRQFLKDAGITVPLRTDCALCYGQRIGEWYLLWRDHRHEYAKGEAYEERTGYTFRSPSRDTWPAPLKLLRLAFESGRRPRRSRATTVGEQACRVCSL